MSDFRAIIHPPNASAIAAPPMTSPRLVLPPARVVATERGRPVDSGAPVAADSTSARALIVTVGATVAALGLGAATLKRRTA